MAHHQQPMKVSDNKARMQRGELYHAFTPELTAERYRCVEARHRLNDNRDPSRRARVALWRDLILDARPLPPPHPDPSQDDALFENTDPYIDPPLHCDYGTQLRFAPSSYINAHCTFIDTMPISIGARTLLGPGCHVYSGTHPLDPAVRDGIAGPEGGAAVVIEDDCWIAGNVTVLPGVTVRRGTTVGAGSVVSRSVGPFELVVGNPARAVRKIESAWADERPRAGVDDVVPGLVSPEGPMAEEAEKMDELVRSQSSPQEASEKIEQMMREAMA